MNKHFHNLVLGVSVLPALLIMPAVADYKYKMPEVDSFATLPNITTTITDNENGYNLFVGTGIRNIVSGDVNLSVTGTKDTPVVILKDGSSWNYQKPTGIIGNLYFPKSQASNWGNAQEAEYASSSYITGDLNIKLDHVDMDGAIYGTYAYLDTSFYNSALENQPDLTTGVKGTTTISVNNSTVGGTIYAAAVPSAGAEPQDNKQAYADYLRDHVILGDVVVNINNSEVGEVTPVGAYLAAKNVEINIKGNSDITDSSGDGVLAGTSRTGGRVTGNTLVNLDTAGSDNTITVAGYGINSGSRKKGNLVKDGDDDSVKGNATLNMFGGGTITAENIVSYKVKGISTLNLTGGTHANATTLVEGFNEINIDDKSVLNAEKLVMTSADALNITLTDSDNYGKLIVNTLDANGATLNMTVRNAGTYNVVDAENVISNFAWNRENALFDLSEDAGTVTATVKSADKIAEETGVSSDAATAISHVAEAESKQLQDLSVKMQEKLASGDTAAVEHATKAIHPEKESVAQSVSTSVQNTVVNLASARMSAPSVGRSGGDVEFTKGGVWAQGLFNKSKQADAFNGYTRGIALGMDGTINKDWTIGAGYSYAHSDINGTARDTEIDSNTIFVYGQYKPAQWYVNAIANYTMSDYSERGTVLDGAVVTGDYDVDSFGGALAMGYDFANGITPELGLRYMHVNANDYANSYGINTHIDDTDFLTGVIGAKYAFNVVATRHLTLVPQLNAGVKYDLLSDKNTATVAMPGVNAYTLDGNRLKRVGGEFGIGLGMQYRELNVSVNYDIDVREDYTSQTGMLKFRYNF